MKTKITPKLWFHIVFIGLVGQIAWVVENMNFATLCQDIFSNCGRSDLSYIVTTLMVILSAVTATATTVWAGDRCDRMGRRKPFIALGYIFWGVTIMIFALLPMKPAANRVALTGFLLVLFDCVMTFAGSTANDAAFNAWITDNTDPTNRGLVDAVLSMLPIFAVVIVFIGLGPLYSSANDSNGMFFLVLGAIPMLAGILSLFTLRDAPALRREGNAELLHDTFYGFRRATVRKNKRLYITLAAYCLVAISQQTFFSYLINFLVKTLGYGDAFAVPMAVIILGAAVVTGLIGFLADKHGRRGFYLPLLAFVIAGTLSFYCLRFLEGTARAVTLYAGGVAMMGAILSLTGLLLAGFQDGIPAGCEGRFQGVRMCFTVLLPMIIGPLVSMLIGLDAMGMNGEDFCPTYSIFLAAAVIAAFAFIPLVKLAKPED